MSLVTSPPFFPVLRSYASIQALRAFAALVVLLHHSSANIKANFNAIFLFDIFELGWAGVDIFFVISGFIITHSSLKFIGQPNRLGEYAKRRFIRVYPVYWLVAIPMLVVIFILQKQTGSFTDAHTFKFFDLASTLFLGPLHIPVDVVSWSLSYEIYFYCLFGLLIFNAKFRWLLILLGVAVVINSYQVFTERCWWENSRYFVEFWASPFLLEFGFGILVYWLHKRFILGRGAWLLLVAGIVWAVVFKTEKPWDMLRTMSFGIASFAVVWAAVSLERQGVFRVPRLLISLGDASYLIYLIHFPVLVFFNKFLKTMGLTDIWIVGGLDMLLNVGFCYMSLLGHKYIEKPLVAWAKK